MDSNLKTPSVELAVVSPCSTCKNSRSKTEDGRHPCPRAVWLGRRDEGLYPTKPHEDRPGAAVEMPPSWLFAPKDVNPVHLENQHGQLLLWVATVAANGSQVLDPSFDTEEIICEDLPYSAELTVKQYYQHGELKGHQSLLITSLENLNRYDLKEGIYVGGFARPVDFPASFTRVRPLLDYAVPGA